MRALFISNDPKLLEQESAVRARMRAYAREIGTLHVLLRAPADCEISEGPLILHGVRGNKLAVLRMLTKRARALIRSENIEIVSAQDPFEYGWVALRAVSGTDAKLHIQIHTDFCSPWFVRSGHLLDSCKNRLRLGIADRVLPRADGIRVVSKRIQESLRARYRNRLVTPSVLPIAVSSTVPERVAFPAHDFSFTFATIGRLETEKRIQDILKALAQIRRQKKDVGLFVIGEGRERKRLGKLVASLGLEKSVQFLGNRSDAWGLLGSADAYIQASAYEGYGMTLVEAALMGVPIITTDVGVVGEIFVAAEDVLVSQPGDNAQVVRAMISTLEDPEQGAARARSAESKARQHLEAFANLPVLIARDLSVTLGGSRSV